MSMQPKHLLQEHLGSVYSVCFAPDCKTLVSAGSDGTLKFWDVKTGLERKTLRALNNRIGELRSVATSPFGGLVAAGGGVHTARDRGIWGEGRLSLWDGTTGQRLAQIAAHSGIITCVAFSSDGKTLVSGGLDGTAKLWDVNMPR
jgi:WD40 repeat protein